MWGSDAFFGVCQHVGCVCRGWALRHWQTVIKWETEVTFPCLLHNSYQPLTTIVLEFVRLEMSANENVCSSPVCLKQRQSRCSCTYKWSFECVCVWDELSCVCISSCGDKPILIPWSPRASQEEDVDVELAVSAPESTAFCCITHTHIHRHTHTHTETCTLVQGQCLFCKCEAPRDWISPSNPVCNLSCNTAEPQRKKKTKNRKTSSDDQPPWYPHSHQRSSKLLVMCRRVRISKRQPSSERSLPHSLEMITLFPVYWEHREWFYCFKLVGDLVGKKKYGMPIATSHMCATPPMSWLQPQWQSSE